MDKLKPILRNYFWILVGLVVPLVLYGYYSANGSLKAATAEREKALADIKNNVSSGHEPNEDYIKKLEHINTFLEASVQDAIVDLWRKQQERMTWPQAVAARIPDEFMGEFDQQVPFIYKGLYPELIRRLQLRAQPVEPAIQEAGVVPGGAGPMEMGGRPAVRKPPVKTVNQKLILAGMVPHARFGQFGITSQEMWDAQIDIWLTEILIDAIVQMNADKESISEAVIRRVDLIELMGGSGERVTKDGAAAGGDMGGMPGMEGAGGMGMGGMGTSQIPTTTAFLPEEEFGSSLDAAAGGGGDPGMGMSAEGGMGGMTAAPPKRYIAETEESPFLERGFYLSVIIMQTKIPDFIVALANSDWPVQVRRFQVGVNPYRVDQPLTGTEFSPGMGGMGMGGMGMSGGEGGFPMPSPRGGRTLGGMGGMNSGMGGMDGNRTEIPNLYGTSIPEFAVASLNHPDLVQLDLCGIITIYKQPKEALAAVEARKQTEAAAVAVPAPESSAVPAAESAAGLSPESAPVAPNPAPQTTPDAAASPADGPTIMTPPAAGAPSVPGAPGTTPPSEADLTPVVPGAPAAQPATAQPPGAASPATGSATGSGTGAVETPPPAAK